MLSAEYWNKIDESGEILAKAILFLDSELWTQCVTACTILLIDLDSISVSVFVFIFVVLDKHCGDPLRAGAESLMGLSSVKIGCNSHFLID